MKDGRNDRRKSNVDIGTIEEENIESLKGKGRIDRRGSSKFKKIAVLVLVSAGIVIGATIIPKVIEENFVVPEVSYTLEDTISANANAICFDEVLENNQKLVEEMVLLENYLSVSSKIGELNLSKYEDVIASEIDDNNIIDSFNGHYQEYLKLVSTVDCKILSNESLRYFELVSILKGYEEQINSKITSKSYSTVADYGILLLKSILLDASNLSYDKIENIVISSSSEPSKLTYTDPVSGQVFVIDIAENSFANKILQAIYKAQSSYNNTKENSKIRNELSETINYYKVAQYMTFGNEGTLKNITNYKEVRDALSEQAKTK